MNKLFQPIIVGYWNEDTMTLMEKCFMLKLNLISRMVFGFQVSYATSGHYSTVFQRYFHFVRSYRVRFGTGTIGNLVTKIRLNSHFQFWIIDLHMFDMQKRGEQFKIIIWIGLGDRQKLSMTSSFSHQTMIVSQINLDAPMSLISMGLILTISKDWLRTLV